MANQSFFIRELPYEYNTFFTAANDKLTISVDPRLRAQSLRIQNLTPQALTFVTDQASPGIAQNYIPPGVSVRHFEGVFQIVITAQAKGPVSIMLTDEDLTPTSEVTSDPTSAVQWYNARGVATQVDPGGGAAYFSPTTVTMDGNATPIPWSNFQDRFRVLGVMLQLGFTCIGTTPTGTIRVFCSLNAAGSANTVLITQLETFIRYTGGAQDRYQEFMTTGWIDFPYPGLVVPGYQTSSFFPDITMFGGADQTSGANPDAFRAIGNLLMCGIFEPATVA